VPMDRQTDRQTDGRTDMTKLIVAFRNFANAPKSEILRYLGGLFFQQTGPSVGP
jgi:hypothetical protein